MPLRTIGNMYFGAGTFGDPAEAARQRMPSSMLDEYSPEEMERMGRDIQRRLRNPFESRSGITQDFRQNLQMDMDQRRQQGVRDVLSQFDPPGQFGMARPGGLLSPEAGPQGALLNPEAGPQGSLLSPEAGPQGAPAQQQQPGSQESPWARMALKGQSLLAAGFIEEGESLIKNASRIADLPDQQQQQIEQEQNQQMQQQVFGALDNLVEQDVISPERAAILRARPLEEVYGALYEQSTLNPGQQRFNNLGQPIAQVPTSDVQEYLFAQDNPEFFEQQGQAESTAAMRNREYKINDYMHTFGMDRPTATAHVDNQVQTDVTDRGQVFTSIPSIGQFQQEDIEQPPTTLPDWTQPFGGREPTNLLEGADPSTGVWGALQRVSNQVAGAVGANEPFPATGDYFNALSRLQTDSVMRMGSEWPGRPSNFVIEQFEKLTFDPERLWQGDQQAVRDLRTFTDLINRDLQQSTDRYKDPQTTADERAELAQKIRTLNDLKASYDQALELFQKDDKPPLATQTPESEGDLDTLLDQYAPE